jgi:hypothetical protein
MAAPIRVLTGTPPITAPEPEEPISCKPSDKCPHGVFRREYCTLCPEFLGYSEPVKKGRTVKGTTVLGHESADVFQCSCNGAGCRQCKPYTPAYRRRTTLSHPRRMWVEIKTDHNGHRVRPKITMREIYTLETHQFRLAQEFRFNQPIQKREIPDDPFRGWLTGLGKSKLASDLYKLPKPGRQRAIRYMRWVVGQQRRRSAKRYVRWSLGLTYCRMLMTLPVPDGEWTVFPREHRQYHPVRQTRQELINFYRSVAPKLTATWRLREEASWHRLPLYALPDDLPYEPFELAYPYCERNPASRWPRVWMGPSVMPRHTVFNSAVGLEFTDRTLADARRSYLISQPLLADLWGCSQRTVWNRLQETGRCACRVCLAAKMPEFRQLLHRAILASMPAVIMWRAEVGSQKEKQQQRKLDKRRNLSKLEWEPDWGWDKKE